MLRDASLLVDFFPTDMRAKLFISLRTSHQISRSRCYDAVCISNVTDILGIPFTGSVPVR